MDRISVAVDGYLAGAVDDALCAADLVRLNEGELVLPRPRVDDSLLHLTLLSSVHHFS
jgi:hypothetical protein